MNDDDDSRQGIRARMRPGRAERPRKAGEPNVLTGAAVPNQLSGLTTQPANVTTGTRPGAQPAPVPARTTPATPAGRQLPAIPTLIFLGFVGLTAFRMLGQVLEGATTDPTPAPGATAIAPGPVRFGTNLDDDCTVSGEAATFDAGADVWWSAEMATRQDATATVVVIVRRDGAEIEREVVPPDDSGTPWSVLCSGGPVADRDGGTYRVEVWSEGVTVLHAAGEYAMAPGSG